MRLCLLSSVLLCAYHATCTGLKPNVRLSRDASCSSSWCSCGRPQASFGCYRFPAKQDWLKCIWPCSKNGRWLQDDVGLAAKINRTQWDTTSSGTQASSNSRTFGGAHYLCLLALQRVQTLDPLQAAPRLHRSPLMLAPRNVESNRRCLANGGCGLSSACLSQRRCHHFNYIAKQTKWTWRHE
jgi:hypothetical protein